MRKNYIPNKNGRFYEKDSFVKAVNEYKELVDSGQAFGELDPSAHDIVSLKHVSHRIDNVRYVIDKLPRKKKKKLKKQGFYEQWKNRHNHVSVKMSLLNTPNGKVLKDFFKDANIGMRAIGETRMKDGVEYVEHTEILGFDFISPGNLGKSEFMAREAVKKTIFE